MPNERKIPEPFTDIPTESWVDRWFPEKWVPYAKLMRLDRPIGVYLLLIPGLWSIAAAARTVREMIFLTFVFTMGSIVMRGAGCVYNDILDMDIDRMVVRTRNRPLASGAVSVRSAVFFILGLVIYALVLLLSLNRVAVFLGFFALIPVAIYPILKRFTHWPQVMLGIAFNWGALLGWAAADRKLSSTAFLLYGAGFCWTMIYDTIYAHQDKEDDLLIGVKSTALKFGKRTPYVLLGFSVALFLFLYAIGFYQFLSVSYFIMIFVAFGGCAYQVMSIDYDNATQCLSAFKQQAFVGWVVLGAILLGRFA